MAALAKRRVSISPMLKRAKEHMNSQPDHAQIAGLIEELSIARQPQHDLPGTAQRHGVSRQDAEAYARLIGNLNHHLVAVKPSARFAQRLHQDLMGAPTMNVISRIRYLPPRVQVAAGLALIAGFMLLLRRQLLSEPRQAAAREAELTI
jgi:hypothetical protein